MKEYNRENIIKYLKTYQNKIQQSSTKEDFISTVIALNKYLLKRDIIGIEELKEFTCKLINYAIKLTPYYSINDIFPRNRKRNDNEKKILELYAKGYSKKKIAEKVGLAVSTVRGYVDYAYSYLNVNTKDDFIEKYNSKGI